MADEVEFHRRHKLFGNLFSGRYKALIVDGSGNGYLRTVCDYVHLNLTGCFHPSRWIAEGLRMGAPGYVNHLLYHRRKAEGE